VDPEQDVGLAVRKGERVEVRLFHGKSALDPGQLSDQVETVGRLLSPLSQEEVGTIRCIGLNVSELFRRGVKTWVLMDTSIDNMQPKSKCPFQLNQHCSCRFLVRL
jgi:hypothetical protein